MMHRFAQFVFVTAAFLLASPAYAERSVVLVTNDSCAMRTISMLDVRKAYFGIEVRYQGSSIRAFRLMNDDVLGRVFYQSVVVMSEKTYERRLLLQLLKYGQPRPREFRSVGDLVSVLSVSGCGIAYMWSRDAAAQDGLKTLRVLWKES